MKEARWALFYAFVDPPSQSICRILRGVGVPAAQKELPEPEVLEERSAEVVSKHEIYVDGYGELSYRSTKGWLTKGTTVRGIENRGLSLYVEPIETEE